ncbi:predicted protein [Phaeodactylum tricornutum CCAP 1055/1]|uniref:Uncharacterized protein n=2 Tax=Phaeodactylum tricornutum TaxID=2850 RepID=B7G6I3_PHATC|nr:predicted protein [Phaeodactylum tricornutum CCAP 1055/1]EEC45865.1 predicted protein [Phaeodactylum tricornutum CCAP 1055/1]|eukprot:XP_002182578.1 predicted protein [Phaeodactylum tricornutum CCAP 1055/1]
MTDPCQTRLAFLSNVVELDIARREPFLSYDTPAGLGSYIADHALGIPETFTRSSATLLTAIPEDDGNTSPEDNDLISTEIEPRFGDQRASPLADETTTFQEKLDAILDTQFFNPDDYNEDSQGPVAWFAKLVKNDYELAEALFVGLLFVILVIVSQELLRMQLFGSNYAPFQTGAGMGRLF